MQSPVPTIMMVVTYLYVILILGPRLMANRKPFKLREVLIAYNGAQVFYSLLMLYEVICSCISINHQRSSP
jgi:elongation of very long chain fatty acids protein 7